jgi:hypothetical protein
VLPRVEGHVFQIPVRFDDRLEPSMPADRAIPLCDLEGPCGQGVRAKGGGVRREGDGEGKEEGKEEGEGEGERHEARRGKGEELRI